LVSKPEAQDKAAVSNGTGGAEHSTASEAMDDHTSDSDAADGDGHGATGDGNTSEAEEAQQHELPLPPSSAAAEVGKNHSTCRWSTGTGPRIRCVRDYPQDLQSRALEHVNLSPRLTGSPSRKRDPLPSPRPSPAMILSPRLASVGFHPQTTVSLTLPDFKRSRLH
jgi:hypothetical protein